MVGNRFCAAAQKCRDYETVTVAKCKVIVQELHSVCDNVFSKVGVLQVTVSLTYCVVFDHTTTSVWVTVTACRFNVPCTGNDTDGTLSHEHPKIRKRHDASCHHRK